MGDRLFYRDYFLHQEGCGAPSSSLRRWRIFGGKEEDSSSPWLAMLVSVPGPSSTNSDPVADGGFATPCRPAPPRHGIARRHRAKTCFSSLIRYGKIFTIGESPGQGSPYRCSSPGDVQVGIHKKDGTSAGLDINAARRFLSHDSAWQKHCRHDCTQPYFPHCSAKPPFGMPSGRQL